ncbi:WD and tetratricopeptide repeats protein 1 [Anastrepha ludens]|uniref:WD and tetratricopeptide repeats protein 1 n=1 Tax=Anastrepha ludens TaxID=28586 RepID=UPI0023B0C6AF|nr:WD and tetratricopeptide repeats protein 1 [Anastrepha ludens]XP_053966713.1 WD and tetratricopeptide repeats protein 1 [Anastrepha ludens]XP_053966714.1 WD and tetratricopeptide repeats protein 1 [Anastrepha ludens]XP_053966715.1 WD and tetratricopeptide repeats protein 1 [Anastrepha ludens]XP_053966716.1 WD and tetratricopeptide repeats protein 1 [Anastrepha ludens]
MFGSRWSRYQYDLDDLRHTNATELILDRQYGNIDRYVQRRLHVSSAYIDRLEQETILRGHQGCVNCIEWSSNGRILASGSDDFCVMLWDPFRKRCIRSIPTKHCGNIFSVKFLPRHNDALIATGAGDRFIYVFDVNRHNEAILSCSCHAARVKRLATAPDSPFVFWSAGEDGAILQLDTREQHRCGAEENRVRLINLTTYVDTNTEAKCLAVNPRRTELLAVGANDPYARIYDRRMLHPVSSHISGGSGLLVNGGDSIEGTVPKDCVTYYCPGHISKDNSKLIEHDSRAITYLTFNSTGTELLVNMGGEHIYLYDLLNAEQPVFLSLPEYKPPPTTSETDIEMAGMHPNYNPSPSSSIENQGAEENVGVLQSAISPGDAPQSSNRRKLPEYIERYKKMGNDFLENEKYLRAVEKYSEAIEMAPNCSVLYLNRATAYMRRLWFGDVYAALRDCHQALRLDPAYIKAHFRLARALLVLGRPQEADECLKELIARFPSYANNHGIMMLHKDIKENRQMTQSQQLQQQQQQQHGSEQQHYNCLERSDAEYQWRSKAKDYSKRFVGHCNTTTDIKESNYFGNDGEYIVAGSDNESFFIWERSTEKIRAIYKADRSIVNCVQPHPEICLLATSGIDHDIKIWSPIAPSPDERPNLVEYVDKTVEDNQQKMKMDPFNMNAGMNAFCLNG